MQVRSILFLMSHKRSDMYVLLDADLPISELDYLQERYPGFHLDLLMTSPRQESDRPMVIEAAITEAQMRWGGDDLVRRYKREYDQML